MATSSRTACVRAGYMYEFEGRRNWRSSKDDRWDVVVRDAQCGRLVGERRIDGAQVKVVRVRGKYYAALFVDTGT